MEVLLSTPSIPPCHEPLDIQKAHVHSLGTVDTLENH